MTLQIVILALIAAFLGLRLYAVLGQRPEHGPEQPGDRASADRSDVTPAPRRVEQADKPAPRAVRAIAADDAQAPGRRSETASIATVSADMQAERGLRAILAADRRFDALSFIEGARGAYGMILEAFWRGDREALSQLCDSDVLAGFVAEITAREAAGETSDNRLIRINDARITNATLNSNLARITVRFDADIASVTRDSAGTVIAGSLNDALQIHDSWTFSRNLASQDPDWLLDETDEG